MEITQDQETSVATTTATTTVTTTATSAAAMEKVCRCQREVATLTALGLRGGAWGGIRCNKYDGPRHASVIASKPPPLGAQGNKILHYTQFTYSDNTTYIISRILLIRARA